MSAALRRVPPTAVVAGIDFSTGSVKGIAFDLNGDAVAEVRLPTDLWTADGVSELSGLQLEGQARAVVRGLAAALRDRGRLGDWAAVGVSATHHTGGRLDARRNPVRRLICWNDQTLAPFHARGLGRLGGPDRARELTGGPWAVRYTLSHLVKDEHTLPDADWDRTAVVLTHGPMAAGFLTGNFAVTSVSAAASTGILDLRTCAWRREMLCAIADPVRQEQAWKSLPHIIGMGDPVGPLADGLAAEAGLPPDVRPLVFPTLDDQAAGLVGGGAVDAGQVAVILGNSAVVNSSAADLPASGTLDAMRTNWGPYLWMRCYSNGAQFLDRVVGTNPDWAALEAAARAVPPGCGGASVLPFVLSEPSVGLDAPKFGWHPDEPADPGVRLRAAFEAIAYLIALGVREHQDAGQAVSRITVSGGIARSDLMCDILAAVLGRPVTRLVSAEGPALGAAVGALAGLETYLRRQANEEEPFPIAGAVDALVKFRGEVEPRPEWVAVYRGGLQRFAALI